MKYLSNYMQNKQTEAFEKYGAFFAFSEKQFNEKKQENVTYQHIGAGLIVPKGNAEPLMKALSDIHKKAINQDIAKNGIKAIIWRELANHECQITMDYSSVIDLLDDYGITPEQIAEQWKPFFDDCIENDYF